MPVSPSAQEAVTSSEFFNSSVAFPVPTMAGTPSSLAIIAAWQVLPPRLVIIAEANFMTGSQSGSVMSVTSTSPSWTESISDKSLIILVFPVPIFWPMALPSTIVFDVSRSL